MTTTPLSDSALENWPEFTVALRGRLEAGRRTYGDASFLREPAELTQEIEQELLDVVGWAFVLWCRMRALQNRLGEVR